MRNLLQLFLTGLLALSLCACGEGGGSTTAETPGVTDSTIVLGTWGPRTVPAALYGNIVMGMDAYFKMINEEGGINGRRIRVVIKDDGYDPSRTVPAVREMVQKDNVFAFVGGVGTANGEAVMDYLVENNIPWISPITGSASWAFPPKKNIFSIFPLYFDEAEVQVNYAVDSLKASKIAVIYQNDDFGKSGLVAAREIMAKKNLSPVAEISVEITDTDLSSHATRLKQSGAAVVLLWTTPRPSVILVTTAGAMGYTPQWISSTPLSDLPLMYDISKGAWKGVMTTYFGGVAQPLDTSNAVIRKYKDAMAKYYPDIRWGLFPLAGFLYADPLAEGLRRAGKELTRENLIASLEGITGYTTMEGAGPTISFGEGQRQGYRACMLIQCTGPTETKLLSDPITATSDPMTLIPKLQNN